MELLFRDRRPLPVKLDAIRFGSGMLGNFL
jgi:hypothetical protein